MLVAFNKPFGVLCQFSRDGDRPTLADFIDVPGIYPCGRLDTPSEGLLLLTDDGALQHRLSHPKFGKEKGYWVLVERIPEEASLARLRDGVRLKGRTTRPARVDRIQPPNVWPRDPPVRFRKNVPDCWLDVRITEGMNRQVRRMTAHVGHPTLRLIRYRIGDYTLGELAPGAWRAVGGQ